MGCYCHEIEVGSAHFVRGWHISSCYGLFPYSVRKLINLRLFEGENEKRWDRSVKDLNYEILCVSQVRFSLLDASRSLVALQFTLYSVLKGNRPDFHLAMAPDRAPQFYENFVERLRKEYDTEKVKSTLVSHVKYIPFGIESYFRLYTV